MRVSPKGLLEIVEVEGLVLGPYRDSKGIWTDGVGHTANAGGVDPGKMDKIDTRGYSPELVRSISVQKLRQFAEDLEKYEARVNKAITVPLKQYEFDALVSFDFNTGGIYKAQLTKQINSGNKSGKGFMGWLKPPEIIGRREDELALFRTGNYAANGSAIPLYDATKSGQHKRRGTMDTKALGKLLVSATGNTTKVRTRTAKKQDGLERLILMVVRSLLSAFGVK